ncbi:MAG: YHS domain-containing protein [Pseudohongiellaceae bacterium]|jgi:YHS domain-containing protein
MRRLILTLLVIFVTASSALAHFAFIVPEPGGGVAYVILSEDLEPDEQVGIAMIQGIQLSLRGRAGGDGPLVLIEDDDAYRVHYSDEAGLIFGVLELGIHQAGDKPANLVTYYPKAILGDAFAPLSRVAQRHPVELIPVGQEGELRLKMLVRGEALAGADVTVFTPDGGRLQVLTDEHGLTETFTQTGRYGAWARAKIGGPGQHDGEDYVESRGYATLVAQVGESRSPSAPAAGEAMLAQASEQASATVVGNYAPLPESVSSFGAVEADGWMYVYGGHIARTHDYDTEAVSGRFSRLNLDQGSLWENLPGGPRLQGMNLTAHNGMVYRVGGMQPRNARGTKADNYSVADCTRFNPETMQWEWLAPLPEGRSSHDLEVIDDKLYVIGGWNMLGDVAGSEWINDMVTLDLGDPRSSWKRVPQPFSRRALITSVHEGRLYVMGGIDDEDEVSRRVDIFDPQTLRWTRGPDLLGSLPFAGFSSAACTLDGRLYTSVAGGEMMRLAENGEAWEMVANHTPRIVHRLIPWRGQILVSGGAEKGANLDLVETVVPSAEALPYTPSEIPAASFHHRPTQDSNASAASGSAGQSEFQAAPHGAQPLAQHGGQLGPQQICCPVMTMVEVLDDEDAIVVEYNGQEVLLCCSKCVKKWQADPEAYLSKETLPQLAAMDLPERSLAQVYCPVFPTRVVSENDPFVIYNGKKIYLFNKTAVRRWNEDPEKYLNSEILPQLAD